eukprot:gene9358-biopygen16720
MQQAIGRDSQPSRKPESAKVLCWLEHLAHCRERGKGDVQNDALLRGTTAGDVHLPAFFGVACRVAGHFSCTSNCTVICWPRRRRSRRSQRSPSHFWKRFLCGFWMMNQLDKRP